MSRTLIALAISLMAAGATNAAEPLLVMPNSGDLFDWSGFYIGGSGGLGGGETSWSNITVPSSPGQNLSGEFSSSRLGGLVGGLHAGYNIQTGTTIMGVEGGLTLGRLGGTDTCFGNWGDFSADCETKVNWMGDIAVRLGFTPTNRVMMYAKGGASLASISFTPANEVGFAPTGGYGTTEAGRLGLLIGVGAELALDNNWIVGIEADYRNFGNQNTSFTPTGLTNSYNPPFSADTSVGVFSVVGRISHKM